MPECALASFPSFSEGNDISSVISPALAGFFYGVIMPVHISGVLKDGAGKPIENCTIQLKAKRNSTTVVVNTVASENPDEAGSYAMDVEYGQYSVILLVEGYPPAHAGMITVYEDSKPGTLNDFLGALSEDDVRPEALRRFEQMVEEAARNAASASQYAVDAKKSASDASASAGQAATHATDAADSARAASTSSGLALSSAQLASSSAETASIKATEASKSATTAESSKNAAATSAAAAKTSETNAAASQQSAATSASTATTKASEAAISARDAAASKEAAKSSETNASSSASSAASSATAAGNAAKVAKTSETNAKSSETAAEQSASAAAGSETAAALSASEASTKATEAADSAAEAARSKSAAESAATRSENAAKRAEDIASAVGLEDASTTKKGIVQLSSSTDSTSETLAVTPKAVKIVMDETKTKAPLDSPAFTGTPTTPTPPDDASGLETANAAFVRKLIAALVGSSPEALDTLNELAAALGNDPNFATTMTNLLAGKQPFNEILTSLSGLAAAGNKLPYFNDRNTMALANLTAVGRVLIGQNSKNEVLKYLGLEGSEPFPAGIPLPWPLHTPPAGWLKCNGASFSAEAYPALAKVFPTGRLPDLRGEFIRGWDDGRGVDAGRTLLSSQEHAIEYHSHRLLISTGRAGDDRYISVSGGTSGAFADYIEQPSGGEISGIDSTGEWETRPRNIAFNYIVRAA